VLPGRTLEITRRSFWSNSKICYPRTNLEACLLRQVAQSRRCLEAVSALIDAFRVVACFDYFLIFSTPDTHEKQPQLKVDRAVDVTRISFTNASCSGTTAWLKMSLEILFHGSCSNLRSSSAFPVASCRSTASSHFSPTRFIYYE